MKSLVSAFSLGDAIAWVATIVLSVVFTILIQEQIYWALASILRGIPPRNPRSVQGIWHANYSYRLSNHETREEEQFIELRQFRHYVWGSNLTGSKHHYRIHGKLDRGIYLTGLWDASLDRNMYHGAFQLILAPTGETMKGQWVGFSSHGHVNHGPWEWRFVTRRTDQKTMTELVKRDRLQ